MKIHYRGTPLAKRLRQFLSGNLSREKFEKIKARVERDARLHVVNLRTAFLAQAESIVESANNSKIPKLRSIVARTVNEVPYKARKVFIDLCMELAAKQALVRNDSAAALKLSLAFRSHVLFATKESAFVRMKNLPAELIEEQLNHSKGIHFGIHEADLTSMYLRRTKTMAEVCLARGDRENAINSVLRVLDDNEGYFNYLFDPGCKNDEEIIANIKLDAHGEISEASLVYIQDLAKMDAAIRAATNYCAQSSVDEIRHLEARFKQMQTEYNKFVDAIFIKTELNLQKPLLNCLGMEDIDSRFLMRVAALWKPKKPQKQVTVDSAFIDALISAAKLLDEYDLENLVKGYGVLDTLVVNRILDHVAFSPDCKITKEGFVKLLQAFRANGLFASEASVFVSKRSELDKELLEEAMAHLNKVKLEL